MLVPEQDFRRRAGKHSPAQNRFTMQTTGLPSDGWLHGNPHSSWHALVKLTVKRVAISGTHIKPKQVHGAIPKFMKSVNYRFPNLLGPPGGGFGLAKHRMSVPCGYCPFGKDPRILVGQKLMAPRSEIAGSRKLATIFSSAVLRLRDARLHEA